MNAILRNWFFASKINHFESIPDVLTCHILGFLDERELRIMDTVNRQFQLLGSLLCKQRFRQIRLIPTTLSHRQLFLCFPNILTDLTHQKQIGKIDLVPIPENLIQAAPHPRFKLVFIPEFITITVDQDSPLMLEAIDGKEARLIEDSDRAPRGERRELRVPVTCNNLLFLTNLKKLHRFNGIYENSMAEILEEHGDSSLGPSHWSYQRRDPLILKGKDSYEDFQEQAAQEGLRIVSLGDRIAFHLFSNLRWEKATPLEITSTRFNPVLETNFVQVTIQREVTDSGFQLRFTNNGPGMIELGAAVEVL